MSAPKYYDAVIVGAGAGGGVAACVLAEAGHRVLLLERGPDLGFSDIGRDHLRSQRLSIYGHNAGPSDDHPRVLIDASGKRHELLPWQGGYNNNAACIGGGTRVYGAQAWRFMPQDFQMASRYGVPDGSSLADWPLSYDDLAPWYERIEWELGVAGDSERILAQTPRDKPYPLPPIPPATKTKPLQRAADALGWATFPVPMSINTVPYGGRGACIQCTECVGFPCPTGAKAGSHNTFLPRALATGCCEVQTGAVAERIETDASGRVVGLKYFAPTEAGYESQSVRAKIVICAAGAIESARLLLGSASAQEPHGLGNNGDGVGRHLQGHVYTGALGVTEEIVWDNQGPGPTIATNRWNHGNEGLVGGGMLADDFLKPPIDFWRGCLPPDVPRWGAANKAWMRDNFRRTLHIMGPVQDIPHPDSRIRLDPDVRDAWGIPVAHLSGTTHPETVRVAEFMRARAGEWLQAAGCHRVWSNPANLVLSAGQHQAGTCRMGNDPQISVCDSWGRVHSHDNLFVCDGSVHVSNGGFNPFLTIMALSARNADFIARQL